MIKLAFSCITSINRNSFLEGNSAIHFESLKNAYSFIPVILRLGLYLVIIIIDFIYKTMNWIMFKKPKYKITMR